MALHSLGTSPATLTHYEFHSHDYWEVILNLEGAGTAVIADRSYPFSPRTAKLPRKAFAISTFIRISFPASPKDRTAIRPVPRTGIRQLFRLCCPMTGTAVSVPCSRSCSAAIFRPTGTMR